MSDWCILVGLHSDPSLERWQTGDTSFYDALLNTLPQLIFAQLTYKLLNHEHRGSNGGDELTPSELQFLFLKFENECTAASVIASRQRRRGQPGDTDFYESDVEPPYVNALRWALCKEMIRFQLAGDDGSEETNHLDDRQFHVQSAFEF